MKKTLFTFLTLFSLLFTLTLSVDIPDVNATEISEELECYSDIPILEDDRI